MTIERFACGCVICDSGEEIGRGHIALPPGVTCGLANRRTARTIVASLAALDADARADVLAEIRGRFCLSCGREQPGGRGCQCENDE